MRLPYPCQPKIDQFQVAIGTEDKVLRPDVPVENSVDVKELYSCQHVCENPFSLLLRESLFLDVQVPAEVASGHVLGHEIKVLGVLKGVAHVVEEWAHKLAHESLFIEHRVDCPQPVDR